ncbi:MAG: hypothetical protein ABIR33_14985 [Pyrinomonadaceae bacterium]
MLIKFGVNDSSSPATWPALTLNWGSKTWQLTNDKTEAWKQVTAAKNGRFEYKDWGVLWLFGGGGKNIVIVHNPPARAMDYDTMTGTARLYDVEPSMKDTILRWALDVGADSKFFAIAKSPLPFTRSAYIERLRWLMPAPYMSSNNDLLTDKLRKDDPKVTSTGGKYTSCGSLPGFVSKQVAASKGLKSQSFNNWMNKYSLNGTNKVRELGVITGCWVESSSDKKPQPGDIYALLNHGMSNKKTDGISHVGVFDSVQGNQWKTLDLGQHGGFDGDVNMREYRAATTELYGESNQGGGFRVLAGWVDLEKYFTLG